MSEFIVDGAIRGCHLHPYIIAEIGVNHEGDLKLAKELIRQAKEGGAHAAKFQSYKASKLASKNSPAYWDTNKETTKSQHELFKKYDSFGERDYQELAVYCKEVGIDFVSTPFDLEAVDFLDSLMPFFKIASADITNIPLIRKCASKKKPIIMSTGASTLPEIEYAVSTARNAGCNNVSLLHCVLNYPTPEENANLSMIKELERVFPSCTIGYSDHVVPDQTISALEVAVLYGAVVIEKHFTHNKNLPGNDHYHAMNTEDLKQFCSKLKKYQVMTGISKGKDLDKESMARLHARRSIVAARDLEVGETIAEDCLIAKRPGHGISPVHWDQVVGKIITEPVSEDALLEWRMFK